MTNQRATRANDITDDEPVDARFTRLISGHADSATLHGLIGKWTFSAPMAAPDGTVTEPHGHSSTLPFPAWTRLRARVAAVAIDHGGGVYYVTERGIKVQEVEALRALPDPTPEQLARRRELSDWILADGNDLLHGSDNREEL